jgi:hypothetical protein
MTESRSRAATKINRSTSNRNIRTYVRALTLPRMPPLPEAEKAPHDCPNLSEMPCCQGVLLFEDMEANTYAVMTNSQEQGGGRVSSQITLGSPLLAL